MFGLFKKKEKSGCCGAKPSGCDSKNPAAEIKVVEESCCAKKAREEAAEKAAKEDSCCGGGSCH